MPINSLAEPSPLNPYYIITPDYTRFSAGVRVLHLLAHLLIQRGQQAFLLASTLNPKWCAPPLTKEVVHAHNEAGKTPIVIYPEVVHGNLLAAGCVVRYLLNYPGYFGGPEKFPDSDMLLWYSKNMRDHADAKDPVLGPPFIDTSVFFPPATVIPRSGACFYAARYKALHKGTLLPITDNAVEIHGGGFPLAQTQEEIADLFRRCEVFYTYESTGLAFEAVLCGCPVVYIPNDHFQPEAACLPDDWGNTGISWGLNPADIERAKRTVQDGSAKFERWIANSMAQLDEFIAKTQTLSNEPARAGRLRFEVAQPNWFDYQHSTRIAVANAHLHGENGVLRYEKDALRSENVALRSENDALRSENDALRSENDALRSENDALRSENNALRSENEALRTENGALRSENGALRSENDALRSQIRDLKVIVQSAEAWQRRGWFQRAFHRWRATSRKGEHCGILQKLGRSFRKRMKQ